MNWLRVLGFGVALLLGSCAAYLPQVGTITAPVTQNLPTEVIVYYRTNVWNISNNYKGGTAFHISRQFLLTNAHVVSEMDTTFWPPMKPYPTGYVLNRKGGLQHDVEVVFINEELDVAMLYCDTCYEEIVDSKMSVGEIPLGTRAYGGGYGLGMFSIHTGFIQETDDEFLHTDVPMAPGDSGSPEIVLSRNTIYVVGIRSGVWLIRDIPVHHKGVLVKSDDIVKWLLAL